MSDTHIPSRTCYVHNKCRLPECKELNAKYKRDKTTSYRTATASTNEALTKAGIPFADPKLTHGLPSSYEWFGCRCPACTEAFADRQADYRLVRQLLQVSQEKGVAGPL